MDMLQQLFCNGVGKARQPDCTASKVRTAPHSSKEILHVFLLLR